MINPYWDIVSDSYGDVKDKLGFGLPSMFMVREFIRLGLLLWIMMRKFIALDLLLWTVIFYLQLLVKELVKKVKSFSSYNMVQWRWSLGTIIGTHDMDILEGMGQSSQDFDCYVGLTDNKMLELCEILKSRMMFGHPNA